MIRAKQLIILVVLVVSACRTGAVPDVCAPKISRRLLDELKEEGSHGTRYRVVIKLSDSTGVANTVPSLAVDSKVAATGLLTAEDIRRLCVLEQVEFIDLARRFHPLEQH
jgi:hypothetical protein